MDESIKGQNENHLQNIFKKKQERTQKFQTCHQRHGHETESSWRSMTTAPREQRHTAPRAVPEKTGARCE
jgi:ribosomal protein S21